MKRHTAQSALVGAGAPARRLTQRPAAGVAVSRAVADALEERRLLSFSPAAAYPTGPAPIAMVSADFNGDARADLATAGALGVDLLISNPDGTFQAPQSIPAVNSPQALAVGDVNGDAKADLITTDNSAVNVLIGNGNGTFQPAQTVSLPGQFPPGYAGTDPLRQTPGSVAVGDLNGDGKLDLAVTGQTQFSSRFPGYYGGYYYYTSYNNHVNVLLGNGAGGFADAGSEISNFATQSVAIADFNNDGKRDVATFGNGAAVLLGNGDGTVQPPTHSGFGAAGGPTPVGDFDGDGNLDVVLNIGGAATVFEGQGDGTFATGAHIAAGGAVRSVVAGDLNADGKLDLVVNTYETTFGSYGYYGGYDPVTTDKTHVVLGYGDGTFAQRVTSTVGSHEGYGSPNRAALNDFNGDGRLDLAATDLFNGTVTVQLNAGNFALPPAVSIADATVTEGNTGTANIEFTVMLSSASASQVTVQFATAPGTAGNPGDFTALTGTVTFAPNETSKKVTIAVGGDVLDEADETFTVSLSNAAGAQINDGQAVGTIVDNDPAPSITINNVSLAEKHKGLTAFTFTVSLSAASGQSVSVNFGTANGTATSTATTNRDYNATSGSLTFAPGVTTRTVTVFVVADRTRESTETFFVNLSGAVNGVITDSQGLGTILDDDTHGNKK